MARLLLAIFAMALTLVSQGCSRSDAGRSPAQVAASTKATPKSIEPPLVLVMPKAVTMIAKCKADSLVEYKLYLRLRVVPGSCQGYMHKLDLDPNTSEDDLIFESSGVSVVVYKRQVEMLRGSKVDYVEEEGKKGFKVDSPNFTGDAAKKWLAALEAEKDVK